MRRPTTPRRPTPSRLPFHRHLRCEPLEDRRMLSVLFVDADAASGGDGLVWSSAYRDLQDALSQAATVNADADTGNDVDQIWVAEGVYKPSAELEPGYPRSASFSLVDGVTVYGGFVGTEAAVEERDWAAHETVLSGDLGRADDRSDNAHTVVYCARDISAALDGMRIVEGNASKEYNSNAREHSYGGGIYSNGILTITNCAISGNSANSTGCGGGVCSDGTLTVANSTISGNRAGYGGGICNRESGTLTVTNSILSSNLAYKNGGAIGSSTGTLTITNSTLLNNSANDCGGGVLGNGTMTIANSTFSENSASEGGAIYNSGTLSVENSTFSHNSANDGGAIFNHFATLAITSGAFSGNAADNDGGAIYNWEAAVSITNGAFSGNSAGNDGGVIWIHYGSLTVANSTLAGNSASRSGGGICSTWPSTVAVNNSILWRNAGAELESDGSISASHNLISLDPKFVRDPSDGGDGWGDDPETDDIDESANDDFGDLRITSRSPAIDYGDDTLAVDADGNPVSADLDGNPRNYDGSHVDAGAYEFQGDIAAGRETRSLTVNTSEDVVDLYDGRISLREAIYYAVDDSLESTITFDAALAGATIMLRGKPIYIDKGLAIDASASLTVDADDKSRVFVVIADAANEVTLYGLVITGGFAGDYWECCGGGIYTSGRLTIMNCTVRDNSAGSAGCGGGIYSIDGTLEVANTTLAGNSAGIASGKGGGIFKRGGTLTAVNSTFTGNSARYGGGIYNYHGTATVTSSVLFSNLAGDYGGGVHNYAGTMTVTNSVIEGNYADEAGGGVYSTHGRLTIANSTLSENVGDYKGGGVCCSNATVVIANSTISRNSSRNAGGIKQGSGTLTVTNSTISGNSAGNVGGISCEFATTTVTNCTLSGNVAGHDGGGISSAHGPLTITNSTISGNCAGQHGGGIRVLGITWLYNSIVAGNTALLGPDVYQYYGPASGSRTLIGNGKDQTSLVTGVDGNLVGTAENPVDPRFVRAPSDGGDGWGDDPDTEDIDESLNDDYGDLRLRADSPAIDAGDIALLPADGSDLDADGDTDEPIPFDLGGNTRVGGTAVDMGAYEFVLSRIPGDLDNDYIVGSSDLDIVRVNWLRTVTQGSLLDGDPSGDGTVNSSDLDIVRANWGRTTPVVAGVCDGENAGVARGDEVVAAEVGDTKSEGVTRQNEAVATRQATDVALRNWARARRAWAEAIEALARERASEGGQERKATVGPSCRVGPEYRADSLCTSGSHG